MRHKCNLKRPGHYFLSDRCRFWIHEHVGPGRRWCVSTVGAFFSGGKLGKIGCGHFYETRVFDTRRHCPRCSSRPDRVKSGRWHEQDGVNYQTRRQAIAGHECMIRKWSGLSAVAS